MARWEKHGTTSNRTLRLLFHATKIYKILGKRIYVLKAIVEVIEYRYWLSKNSYHVPMKKDKKSLLFALCEEINSGSDLTQVAQVFEFGVAFGETTKILTDRISVPYEYHGFDTFTGLPRAWRGLPKGAISNGGELPNINEPNVEFHKGLVSQTISEVDFSKTGIKYVILDFDLYEPTLLVLKKLIPFLNPGDILYFDEMFDADERVIFENYVQGHIKFTVLFTSIFGLAIRVNE